MKQLDEVLYLLTFYYLYIEQTDDYPEFILGGGVRALAEDC